MIKPSMRTKADGRRWWIAVDNKQATRWPLAYGRWSTRAACERAILAAERTAIRAAIAKAEEVRAVSTGKR